MIYFELLLNVGFDLHFDIENLNKLHWKLGSNRLRLNHSKAMFILIRKP